MLLVEWVRGTHPVRFEDANVQSARGDGVDAHTQAHDDQASRSCTHLSHSDNINSSLGRLAERARPAAAGVECLLGVLPD